MSSSDVSHAAAESRIVTQATRIAAWVGEGKAITARGVPRRSDIPAVARALGVDVSGHVRSAVDVRDIHHPWTVAVATGMISVEANRAVADPDFSKDPRDVWLLGLEGVLRAESTDRGRRGAVIAGSAVLTVLADGQPRDQLTFEYAVLELLQSLTGEAAYGYLLLWVGPVAVALGVLAEFGAVADQLRLTPLGRWAQGQMKTRLPAPISPTEDPRKLLKRLAASSDSDAWREAGPWLAGRSVAEAASQLLRAADGASARQRMAAVAIACGLGKDALPAWEEALHIPDLALHARVVLAAGKPRLNEADQRWLDTEYALAELERSGAEEAYWYVQERGGMDSVRDSGHPNAAALLDALSRLVASGGGRERIYRLKVALNRFRPPVWRRVLVPASATLDLLHEVIQIVMDWSDDHLHAFTVDQKRYSHPSYELDDCEDEDTVRLAKALPSPGAKIAYEYDFGDSWQHTITLEAILDPDGTATYPTCEGGRGDVPIEDSDPAAEKVTPFDRDEINRRLARLTGDAAGTGRGPARHLVTRA